MDIYRRLSNPLRASTALKPLVLERDGKKWRVYLNMPAAHAFGGKGPRMKMYPADAMVPVAKLPDGSVGLVLDGEPARLSKDDADHIAHTIGRYLLGFGDLTYTYVSETG